MTARAACGETYAAPEVVWNHLNKSLPYMSLEHTAGKYDPTYKEKAANRNTNQQTQVANDAIAKMGGGMHPTATVGAALPPGPQAPAGTVAPPNSQSQAPTGAGAGAGPLTPGASAAVPNASTAPQSHWFDTQGNPTFGGNTYTMPTPMDAAELGRAGPAIQKAYQERVQQYNEAWKYANDQQRAEASGAQAKSSQG